MVRNKAGSSTSGSPSSSSIKDYFKPSPTRRTFSPKSPPSPTNKTKTSPLKTDSKPPKSLFTSQVVSNHIKADDMIHNGEVIAQTNGIAALFEKRKLDYGSEHKSSANGIIRSSKFVISPKKEPEMNGLSPHKKETHHTFRMQAQQHASYRKMFGVFKEGHDVLARWSDGLYYLGSVCKVDDFQHKCYIQFEDKSVFWAQFKDLQMINNKDDSDNDSGSDVTCTMCRDGNSDPPNEIVLCDKCGQGYHQLCHVPSIDTSVLNEEDAPWQCRTCVFAAVAKRGGAEAEGTAAVTLRMLKQVLPYDTKSLTWDRGHKVNSEETYCYCGGPGDWYLKMLQCCRCQQWFHEACIQCLQTPVLYGDRFFLFVCSICNHGNEYVKRLPMRWVDVVHLVLYNITIAKLVKYYDFHSILMPFFAQNWESLQLGDLVHEASTRSQLKERVLETLQNNKSRFQCGSESKKAKMSWGLRTRSPPVPPTLTVPLNGEINDDLLATLDLRHGSTLLNDSPTPMKRYGPGDTDGDSPSVKRRFSSADMDWSPTKTNDKTCIEPNHFIRDNLFDRLTYNTRTGNIKENAPSASDEQPKRRRGRPRKNLVKLPTRGRGRPSSLRTRENNFQKPSFSTDASTIIPMHEMFKHNPHNHLPGHTAHEDLRKNIARYFGPEGRIACGERYRVLAKRQVSVKGNPPHTEYLIEWEGYTATQLHERSYTR
ncbi:metal-response element-binding transcription factor 2 [Ciona intestinalis]